MAYRLDDRINVTMQGNTTLTGLTEGSHSLIIYANDTAGNMGASQAINFTVASESFPTMLVAAVSGVLAVAVTGAGLLVYFKKRKREVKS